MARVKVPLVAVAAGHESDEDHVAVYLERPADVADPTALYVAPHGLVASSSASAINAMGG